MLDIVQKFWASLGKLFAPPGVPSWLRASYYLMCKRKRWEDFTLWRFATKCPAVKSVKSWITKHTC